MLKKTIKFFFVLFFLVNLSFGIFSQASTIIPLRELEEPGYLKANEKFLFISDKFKVKIYSLKDFKLIKTIGGKGEGPGEFKGYPVPQILSDSIMISSPHKVSFYDFSGNLKKEKKAKISSSVIKKIDNKYISDSRSLEPDDFYLIYNLYDSDFIKEKELYKGKWMLHKGRKRDLFEIYFFDVYDNKIIFAHGAGFKIEILDEFGNNLHTIELERSRIPFTDKDMKKICADLEKNIKNKGFVQVIKERAIIPKFYPDIRTGRVADGKIYVITYLKKDGRSECLVFDMKGKQLETIFIPLRDISPILPPSFTIDNNHLYQIVENLDEEQWELVIDKIE